MARLQYVAAVLFPFLAVSDVDAAVAFYVEAFDAVEVMDRVRAPDGSQVAVLSALGQRFGVSSQSPELDTLSPEVAGGTTVRIDFEVEDPDVVQARAVRAGAREMFPVEDRPYGMRQGRVVDPSGHHWMIGRWL